MFLRVQFNVGMKITCHWLQCSWRFNFCLKYL